MPPEALTATVERFNGFAETGIDEDFHRGESGYDKYYSDPTVKPNPSLHSIDQGPFYAVKIVPGDLGTKGGLVTDEKARVLRADGSAIPGLYAAGNVSSAVMGNTYAGPGATIGPALTFGYLAAETISAGDCLTAHRPRHRDRRRARLDRLLLVGERRAALPPRPRLDRPLLHARERRPPGAAVLRRRRTDVPRERPAAARPARLRHQPRPGRARLPVDLRHRSPADVAARRP